MKFQWQNDNEDGKEGIPVRLIRMIREAPKKLILMAVCGILILFLSLPEIWKGWSREEKRESKNEPVAEEAVRDETSLYVQEMEERLEAVLGKIEGAGLVSVMLTVRDTREEVTEKNRPSTRESSSSTDGGRNENSTRVEVGEETIFTQTEEGNNVPFVIKQVMPKVEGVLVIMEGADNASLKTEIIEGIQVLFDLPVHKIKVIRMKTAD